MKEDKITDNAPINTIGIILFMILVFIVVQVGFHATYIRYFPEFKQFSWLQHIHGALMASWPILLILQPVLIHKGRIDAHRFIGKLTYVIAPLIIISIFLIARFSYYKWAVEYSSEEVFSRQSITWMQLFVFVLFYSLAVIYKKETPKHMRFMIGTAILVMGPGLSRIINSYFSSLPDSYNFLIPLYLKTGLVAALLVSDILKKKDLMPYLIVLLAFILSDIVYHARYSPGWQAFGRFVIHYLF
jgi:hypothetical protein